ncbi:MAG: polysaccharide deacetylase family protein [Defluviitaleaceae bacterium]|nr:polysaccharide deacetylase family protein [Defluviitaleaceae bacterium]
MRKSSVAAFLCIFAIIVASVTCYATEAEFPDTEVFFHRAKEVQLPVIMYHLVTENPKYIGKYGITPAELERDLAYLKENDYNTVVMQDLIEFVNSGKRLPDNPIMLTFDDGNSGDYRYLLPLLKEYEMKAVVAIIGEASDRFTIEAEENPSAKYPNLTWAQIKELHESGHVEIQSHSYNLHKTPIGSGKKSGESEEAYHARLLADLQKLQEACAAHLGYVPTAFIYPLGVIGENSRAVLEELGMMGSVSCQEGMNTIRQGDKDCLFKIMRTNRPSGRPIEDLLKKL